MTNRFEVCREMYTDIMNKCEQYGKVISIKVPRPIWVGRSFPEDKKEETKLMTYSSRKERKQKELEAVDDIRNYDLPPGFGSVFIEFTSD